MSEELLVLNISLRNLDGKLPVSAVSGKVLMSTFYEYCGELHPPKERSAADARKPVPFSLSMIQHDGWFAGLRIATICPQAAGVVQNAWSNLVRESAKIRVGSAQMIVDRMRIERPQSGYRSLLENASTQNTLTLVFDTPMRLKIKPGETVLPEPFHIWQGYELRWQNYSLEMLPPMVSTWVQHQVLVSNLEISTQCYQKEKNIGIPGSVGRVSFTAYPLPNDSEFPKSRELEYLQAWHALANFAEFCGTGEKTNWGMGKTTYHPGSTSSL